MAKIDTGADFCIFQRDYGEFFGIDIESGLPQTFRTPNSRFETFGHQVEIESFDGRIESVVYFAAQKEFNRNVLGRNGWLNRHRLGIIDHDATVFVSHYNDPNS